MAGLALLTRCELERYRDFIPEDEDLQDEWDAAMGDPEKYVSLSVGQKNNDEQRAELDEENWHNTFDNEQTVQNIILRIMR